MSKMLTSWKEIAQYLGKGVRTVQRWERTFGLPVCRANGGDHRSVMTLAEELDDWVRSWKGPSDLESLRRELAGLRAENASLLRQLEASANAAPPRTGSWLDEGNPRARAPRPTAKSGVVQ